MTIVVIDGQGGGFGRALIEKLRSLGCTDTIVAVGTNATATAAMRKAGATSGATGENAVIVNAGRADIVAGPMGIVIANSMMGECSPAMAVAVGSAKATRVLIPTSRCGTLIAGLADQPLADYISHAAQRILALCVAP